jgi:hypothetical protein
MEHIYMRIPVRKWSIDLKTIVRFMYRHVPYVATPLIVHKNAKYQFLARKLVFTCEIPTISWENCGFFFKGNTSISLNI